MAENNPTVEELQKQIAELNGTISTLQENLEKQKQATSNAASDAANWKKQFRETQDEGTRKAAETEELIKGLQAQVAASAKAQTISDYEKNYLAMGYDAALARSTAEAMADGNMSVVFANQNAFNAAQKKAAEEAMLNKTPQPTPGTPTPTPGSEDDKMVAEFRKAALG